jgi:hypothetical protein
MHDPRSSPPISPMQISSTSCYWCIIRHLRCHDGRGIRNTCRSSGRVMLQETLAQDSSCRRSNTSTSTLSHLSTETLVLLDFCRRTGRCLCPRSFPVPLSNLHPLLSGVHTPCSVIITSPIIAHQSWQQHQQKGPPTRS